MRRQGGVLAFLAALGAFTYASRTDRPADAGRPPAATISNTAPPSEIELAGAFSKFDKSRTYKIDSQGNSGGSYSPKLSPQASFDWAIATVPDPERSLLSLDFDREIEEIQNAATDADYQFERYWLPWRTETGAPAAVEKDASFITTGDGRVVVTHGTADERRKDLPGVLLFRSGQANQRPLAIFLVGETPTGGIAVQQFRAALSLGSSLGNSRAGGLPIIGPGFSGSLDSLAKLIRSDRLHPNINTWTTSAAAHKRFGKTIQEFNKFEVDDTTAINLLVGYIRRTWHDHEPIVILTEEQTAFGAGVAGMKDTGDRIVDANVFKVPFPRNLSRLRNASESQTHVTRLGNSQSSEVPHTGLLLSLKEEEGGEEIPTYSRQQTPVSQESVLFTIGGLLKTDMVHYVGIFATDPLDTLFLARYLRSACPNLRLFVPSPDLLLEHGSDVSDYSGILSVSRYPLFPFSQLWSPGHNGMRVFPSAASEAIYNATLASLKTFPGHERNGRDQTNPFGRHSNPVWITVAGRGGFEPIAVFDSPESSAGTASVNPDTPANASFVFQYWPMWGYLFVCILLCCVGYCVAVLFAKPFGSRLFAVLSTESRQFEKSPHPAAHAFLLSAVGLCLATITAVWLSAPGIILQQNLAVRNPHATLVYGLILLFAGMASVVWLRAPRSVPRARFFRSQRARLQVATAGGMLLLLMPAPIYPSFAHYRGNGLHHLWVLYCVASVILGATVVCSLQPRRALRKAHRRKAPAELASLAVAIAAIFFAYFSIWRNQPVDFLAAYRSLDLTNGVSPLIPISILLVILGVTALFNLRRMAYFADRRPEIPVMRKDEFCSNLSAVKNKINHRISTFRPPPAYFLTALPVALCLTLAWFRSSQTLERPLVDHFTVILVFACGIVISLAWIRLLAIWSVFREFLQQLERHPIRQVFDRLPKGYMWSPVWQGGGQKRTHVLVARSIECMEALLANDSTPIDLKIEARKQVESLRPHLDALLASSAKGTRFDPDQFRSIERSLRKVAYLAVQCLRCNKWDLGHYEMEAEINGNGKTENGNAGDEILAICGEFVAFRFLAYINFVLWHLDNLVTYISAAFLLLVIALSAYAFRSRTVVDWALVAMFAILTTGIVIVFSQLARDAVLSRITGTKEGKLDLNFLSHLVSYGALPVLVLLATHFPTVGRFFFSWVKPALEAIH